MDSTSLEDAFQRAADGVALMDSAVSHRLNQDDKLLLYGLYKQARVLFVGTSSMSRHCYQCNNATTVLNHWVQKGSIRRSRTPHAQCILVHATENTGRQPSADTRDHHRGLARQHLHACRAGSCARAPHGVFLSFLFETGTPFRFSLFTPNCTFFLFYAKFYSVFCLPYNADCALRDWQRRRWRGPAVLRGQRFGTSRAALNGQLRRLHPLKHALGPHPTSQDR